MSQESTLAKAELVLTPAEREAYNKYLATGRAPLAPSVAVQMFQLFLLGHTTQEIANQNPGLGLGIIVRARVENNWDQQRMDHIQRLMDDIKTVVTTTQLEAVQFVADGLAVFRKLAGTKFQKYLQTGKEEDLGDFKDMPFKTYKDLLEMLLKLTGQEPAKKVQGVVEHRHTMETPAQPQRVDRPMSAADATLFLERLDKGKP